jgi:hypothetical protein
MALAIHDAHNLLRENCEGSARMLFFGLASSLRLAPSLFLLWQGE